MQVLWYNKDLLSARERLLVSIKQLTELLCAVLDLVLGAGDAKKASASRLIGGYGSAVT